jgi:hypothetical protein
MGLLTNTDYKGVQLERVIAPGIKRCSLGDLREQEPKADADGNGAPGKGPKSKVIINLILEEPAKTVDGDEVRAGVPILGSINEWEGREDEAKAKMKELALAALGLDRKTKDEWIDALAARGGWAGLKGAHLMVEFSVKKGFNDFKSFNRIPPTA